MPGHLRQLRRKSGARPYQARWRHPNDPGHRVERVFRLKGDAERWLARQEARALDGDYIDPRKASRKLREVADEWRATWTDLEPKTRAGYESILSQHVLPRFGASPVSAIDPERVQTFINELAKTRATNTVRRVYGVLRGVLKVAVQRRYIASNPCDSVSLPRKRSRGPRRRHLYLTPAEVRALAEGMERPAERVAVYVAAWAGPRAGELWALRRGDVDLLHGRLTIERALKEINSAAPSLDGDKGLIFGEPKTAGSHRTISLPAPIIDLLSDYLGLASVGGNGPDDLLFPAPHGGPMRHNVWYKRRFKPAVRASLPPEKHALRFHDLRHTAASLSLAVAPSLHIVKERLGHTSIRTTVDEYGHLLPSVDAALADGLADLFNEGAAPDNVVPLVAAP